MATPIIEAWAVAINQSTDLVALEKIIDKGKTSFVEVGLAIMRIRDARLYKSTHSTWENYCAQRWGWTGRRANQLALAAEIGAEMGTRVPTERHARELSRLPSEVREVALDEAGEGATVQQLGQVVDAHVEKKRDTAKSWFAEHPSEIYAGMRNRSVESGHYEAGSRFYELDAALRILDHLGIKHVYPIDPNYGICGKDPALNGAPEIIVTADVPACPKAPGWAIWIIGTKCRRPIPPQDAAEIDHMRAKGFECTVVFAAEELVVELRRLGFAPERRVQDREPMKDNA